MSETITGRIQAARGTAFGAGAFDGYVGKAITVPVGDRAAEGILRSAEIASDGSEVTLTVELPDGTLPATAVPPPEPRPAT